MRVRVRERERERERERVPMNVYAKASEPSFDRSRVADFFFKTSSFFSLTGFRPVIDKTTDEKERKKPLFAKRALKKPGSKMLDVFSSLKGNVEAAKRLTQPHTEGLVNRLHCSVTVIFLLVASLLVTCLDWVGNGNKVNARARSWPLHRLLLNTRSAFLNKARSKS